MNVTFYKNNSSDNTITKNLTSTYGAIACTIKEPISVLNPVVILEYNNYIEKSNYMYIEEFDRYYYITDIKPLNGSRIQIIGRVDVLMSFKSSILSVPCIIDKQQNESVANMYKDDGSFVTLNKTYDTIINFDKGFNDNGNFILVCAGGKGGVI